MTTTPNIPAPGQPKPPAPLPAVKPASPPREPPRGGERPAWIRLGYAAAGLTALLAALLAFTVRIPQIIELEGRVVGAEPVPVTAPRDAAVQSYLVAPGTRVEAGTPLVLLAPPFQAPEIPVTEAEVARLSLEVARLRAELADVPFEPGPIGAPEARSAAMARHAARQAARLAESLAFDRRLEAVDLALTAREGRIAALRARLDTARATAEPGSEAGEGGAVAAGMTALGRREARIELENALRHALDENAELQAEGAQILAERSARAAEARRQATEALTLAVGELARVRELLDRDRAGTWRETVVSPITGRVSWRAETALGRSVAAGTPMVTLMPDAGPSLIEVEHRTGLTLGADSPIRVQLGNGPALAGRLIPPESEAPADGPQPWRVTLEEWAGPASPPLGTAARVSVTIETRPLAHSLISSINH